MKQNIEVQKVHTFSGHKDCLYTLAAIDDQTFISAGGDGMVVGWDLTQPTKGTMIAQIPASIYAMSYDKLRAELIVGQNFEGIHLIDVSGKKEAGSLKITDQALYDIQQDEKYIYVATGEGELVIIERDPLRILHRIKASDKNARTIAVQNDWVAVGYSDNHIRIFDKSGFKLIKDILAHKISVFTLVPYPDKNLLVSGSRDAHLKVWDTNDFSLIHNVAAHMYAINHIAFSPDSQHFVTCSMDKSIKVWDSQSMQLVKVIDKSRHAGHGTSVNKLLWMNYQNQLVSCSDDRTISVWNINFGE